MRNALWSMTALVCGSLAPAALAQPTDFVDLGEVIAPAIPASAQEPIDTSLAFDFGDGVSPGEVLSVKWLRFDLTTPIAGELYLDVSASLFAAGGDIALGLYDAAGALVASDDTTDGRGRPGSGLSFGSVAERTPPEFPRLRGQSGPTLAAGEYWLAVVAGVGPEVSFGETAWSVQTSASYQLGFGDEDTYLEVSLAGGNTTPLPPPFNDNCDAAAAISEDVGATPAFVGTNEGATQDGTSPCYANIPGLTFKDVWFSYTPTQTGWVQVVASGSASPILTKFSGCFGVPERCSGGGNFVFAGGTRLTLFATQGEPVLFSVAGRAGGVGSIVLNIDPLGSPCTLAVPPGATIEPEACGETLNNGCNLPGGEFGVIAPNEAIVGTLWNGTAFNDRDRDWYRLTITEAAQVNLSVSGQVAVEAVILGPPQTVGACSGEQLTLSRTTNPLAPCVPASSSVVLTPGEYFVAVAHLFADGFVCGSGYQQYVLRLTSVPCEQPTVLTQPESASAVLGGTVSYEASMTGSTDVTYTWQWGEVLTEFNPPLIRWTDLFDGEFSDIFSSAQVSGSSTGTLTITGIDEAISTFAPRLRFRLKGEICAPNFTNAATLTVCPVSCNPCEYDFNQDENVDLLDAQQMAEVFVGLLTPGANWLDGDLNSDENADLTDAQLLAAYVVSGNCGV